MTPQSPHRLPRREHGRTLIELLIAMAIGLVIVAGVASLYVSSSGVSRLAREAGTAEESGQIAMFVIGSRCDLPGMAKFLARITPARIKPCLTAHTCVAALTAAWRTPLCNATCVELELHGAGRAGRAVCEISGAPANCRDHGCGARPDCAADCLGDQAPIETMDPTSGRVGAGHSRRMVTNVFALTPNAAGRLALYCNGSGGGGNTPLVEDVVEFKVFYRLDDAAYFAGAGGATNAAPLGGSVRDATFINGLSVCDRRSMELRRSGHGVRDGSHQRGWCSDRTARLTQRRDVPPTRPKHRRVWRWSVPIPPAECCIARTRRSSRFARTRRRLRR